MFSDFLSDFFSLKNDVIYVNVPTESVTQTKLEKKLITTADRELRTVPELAEGDDLLQCSLISAIDLRKTAPIMRQPNEVQKWLISSSKKNCFL
jgi:hypothetical protein